MWRGEKKQGAALNCFSRSWCFLFAAVIAAVVFMPVPPCSAAEQRSVIDLSAGWRFQQASGLSGVESGTFDDSSWATISVPHTWNRIGNDGTVRSADSNNAQGIGWYRRHFRMPPSPKGARYFLQFDAVGTIAQVWLNGHYLGKHNGAFARFRFDASAAINPSGDNLLVVQADNSKPAPGATTEDIIPLSGDFFMFGGIYRNIALIVTDPVHVDMMDFGGPGVYARTMEITPSSALVEVMGRLINDGPAPKPVMVETTIEDAAGQIVARASHSVVLSAKVDVVRTNLRVANPRLWQGVKDPYLYRATITLRSPKGDVLDRVTQPLGLRTTRFDPDKGFFLNGEYFFLKGVGLHQDRPIKGWAITRADQEQDFDLLTDMGANAVRLAHYQHDQASYELADAKGVAVWAEIPLVNEVSFDGSPPNTALAENARQQLTELIRQNYNHPSIIVWSIANEVNLRAIQKHGSNRAGALLKSLNDLAHREDPSRSTTFADCCEAGLPPGSNNANSDTPPRDVLAGIADTIGYNRYFGWYYGGMTDFGPMLDLAHARHPRLPIAVSEYGAGAALTQHTDNAMGGPINPHGRPHPEELQNLYHEVSWSQLKTRPYVWGVFIWNMFDFASDNRQEGDLTDINEKGLASYDRKVRKDAFYFYRANWSSQPTLHLVGRRYADRPYGVIEVKAYSNAKTVHLWRNGSDIGVASCTDGICLWPAVHLVPGPDTVLAKADFDGTTLSDTLQWNYTGTPQMVRIKSGDITGYVARDGSLYGSDMYFEGGEGRGINPPDTANKDRVAVPGADAALYDSFREGDFDYRIPLPDGRYRILAKFVEPSATAVGQRAFDVIVNGKTILSRFDVFAAAGGRLKSVDRTFEANAIGGKIDIRFQSIQGKAIVSALSVTPSSSGADR
jgi:beta-galactosidase